MTAPSSPSSPVQASDVVGYLQAKLRHEHAAVVAAERALREQLRQMVAYRHRLESTADGAGIALDGPEPQPPITDGD